MRGGNIPVVTAHQYRLRPTASQVALLERWLQLLRQQYTYRLAERFTWWEQNRCDIHACSLTVCHLPQLKEQPTYSSQKQELVNTKALFPVRASGTESSYRKIHSQVLQDCIQQVQR